MDNPTKKSTLATRLGSKKGNSLNSDTFPNRSGYLVAGLASVLSVGPAMEPDPYLLVCIRTVRLRQALPDLMSRQEA